MKTLIQLSAEPSMLPTQTAWHLADLKVACPGVGIDLIRRVLANLQHDGKIRSLGTGRGAKWEKLN